MPREMYPPGHFHDLLPRLDGFMSALEEDALRRDVRITGPDVANLLAVLVRSTGAKRVLEIGTAVGYTGILMARALPEDGRLITMEWDEGIAREARDNIRAAGLEDKLVSMVGDARQMVRDLESGSFDMIFMDHEKEMYSETLPDCVRLLRVGGTLVCDNVAFRTAGDFNRILAAHPQLETSFIYGTFYKHSPDEDAISISVKVRADPPLSP